MSFLYQIFFLALVLKLIVAYFLPLSFDESYYWVWSHHLQLSYFDHPPFVSWLFWLAHPLEAFGNAVRWPGILMSHATLFIWIKILTPFFNVERLKWWLALALLTPLFGLGGMIITPDIPLMFFWSLSLYFLIQCRDKSSYLNFALLGSALGLGFLAKYHIVVFVPLGFLWLYRESRLKISTIPPLLWSILWSLLFSSPVLIWNLQNEFLSFRFQLDHGLSESHWSPLWPLKYLSDQILIIFPTLLFLILKPKTSPYAPLLKIMAWGPLLFFFLATFKADSEANWPIASYPALLALALLDTKGRRLIKGTLVLWGTLFLIVFSHSLLPWLPIDEKQLKSSEFTHFNSLIKLLKKERELRPIYGYSFQMASKLSYEMKEPVYKLKGLNRKDFYDFLPQSTPTEKIFFLAVKINTPLPKWVIQEGYQITRTYGVDSNFQIYRVEKP
ncbi:glycosyltransferase family 39 protein [Bdellovibrionales bacterium]|nr:glycosyltransferase family 39 protein [Bdellovibrionales bacterium]